MMHETFKFCNVGYILLNQSLHSHHHQTKMRFARGPLLALVWTALSLQAFDGVHADIRGVSPKGRLEYMQIKK